MRNQKHQILGLSGSVQYFGVWKFVNRQLLETYIQRTIESRLRKSPTWHWALYSVRFSQQDEGYLVRCDIQIKTDMKARQAGSAFARRPNHAFNRAMAVIESASSELPYALQEAA